MKAFTFWKAVTVDQQGFLERYRTLRNTIVDVVSAPFHLLKTAHGEDPLASLPPSCGKVRTGHEFDDTDAFLAADVIRGERLFARDEEVADEYDRYVFSVSAAS